MVKCRNNLNVGSFTLKCLRTLFCILFLISCNSTVDVSLENLDSKGNSKLFIGVDSLSNPEIVQNLKIEKGDSVDLFSFISVDEITFSDTVVKWSLSGTNGNLLVLAGGRAAKFNALNIGTSLVSIETNNLKTSIHLTVIASSTPQVPLAKDLTIGNVDEGEEKIVVLDYSDANEDKGISCNISNESSVSVSTPCSCDIDGQCSVGVSSDGFYNGMASFEYTVSDSLGASNQASVSLNIVDKVISCPSGFIEVEGRSDTGMNDFCVMQFEAKNISNVATSQANNTPWVSISQTNARVKCRDLGSGYDLLSNLEAMTLGRDIESVDANWGGGVVGNGCLKSGNTGTATVGCSYDGANPEYGTGRDSRAMLTLSNGNIIWDFSGNVEEFVDWTTGGSLATAPVGACEVPYTDVYYYSCAAYNDKDYKPLNPAGVGSYNGARGIGNYTGNTYLTGRTPRRGGHYSNGLNAGVFALTINQTQTWTNSQVGFRCVYRP